MKKKYTMIATMALLATLAACGQTPSDPAVQTAENTEVTAEASQSGETAEPAAQEAPEEAAQPESQPEAAEAEAPAENVPEDGVYSAVFDTDGSMFHVNEVCEGRGILTVENGKMTMHIVMPSQNIVNLYYGLAEDAQKEGAVLIEPTIETVTYPDGLSEEVNAFDIPVPYLDETFDLALIGTKEVWYDHKVSVSDPIPVSEEGSVNAAEELADGTYRIEVTLEGGSGRATITSPAELTVAGKEMTLSVEWSSPNYDYMLVDGTKYLPVNTEGNSVFEIPVADLTLPLAVIGDTVAMSEPHEVEYTIRFGAVSE